jgi:hypothetical protein
VKGCDAVPASGHLHWDRTQKVALADVNAAHLPTAERTVRTCAQLRRYVPKALAFGGRYNKAKMTELNRQRLVPIAAGPVYRSRSFMKTCEPGPRITILMAVSILSR